MFKLTSRTAESGALGSSALYDNETFYRSFGKDLSHASERVYIESPFITQKRTRELIPAITSLRRRCVTVTINTRHPDEHDGKYVDEASEAIVEMQRLGVKVLYTVKHHRKLAIIDDILWEGSLNILSQNNSCEIMRRSVSLALVRQMVNFIGISKYV